MTATFFIGDVAIDEYYATDHWPGPADKGFVRQMPAEMGGSIANAAVVHAALGGSTEFISLLNDGPLSRNLIADLRGNGVGVGHMLRDATLPESRNLIFLVGGEHVVLTVEMGEQPMWLSDDTMAALRQPGFVYTTLYRARRLRHRLGTGDVLERADLLADLRQHGRRLIFDLDVGGCSDDDLPLLGGAEIVIFNETGFRAAFGHDDIGRIMPWMEAAGIVHVIRTIAADGVEAIDEQGFHRVTGYVVPVVDVTGAGDTFGGALVARLSSGQPFPDAMEFAVAAAARSVTIHGPRGGRASIDEVLAFKSAHGR